MIFRLFFILIFVTNQINDAYPITNYLYLTEFMRIITVSYVVLSQIHVFVGKWKKIEYSQEDYSVYNISHKIDLLYQES